MSAEDEEWERRERRELVALIRAEHGDGTGSDPMRLTVHEAVAALRELDDDPELCHVDADAIAEAAMDPALAAAYKAARDQCNGWWYA